MKYPCELCDGSGLLPLVLPDGAISKYAKIFCDCHQAPSDPKPEHYNLPLVTEGRRPGIGSQKIAWSIPRGRRHLYLDDFDFTMSYSVYRSLCQEYGWADPGPDKPPELEPKGASPLFRPRPVDNEVDRLKGEVNYLFQKITELRAKKKKTGRYQQYKDA